MIEESNADRSPWERCNYGSGTGGPRVRQSRPKFFYCAADSLGSITLLADPAGQVSNCSHDSLNRLTAIADSSSGQFGFGYDALSRRTSLTRPNGVGTSYSYDSLSRLLSVLHNGGSLPGSASYTYDAAGNRLTKTAVQAGNPNPVSVLSQYSYDAIYELTQAVVNGTVAEGYSYDAVGNRLTSAGPVSYNYNASNELTSTSAATYAYDNNGNTTSKTTSAGTTSYSWDFENRLASATLPGTGGTVNFQYDPFGRRIYKSSPAGTNIYVYDGANVIQELNGAGSLVAQYTQGSRIDEPLALYQGPTTSYFHADGLGSVTSLTDPTGAVAASYVYDSYGNLTASTGTVTNPFQYTGREFDSETGTYFYRARYYDPATGRFTSEDPIRFDGSDTGSMYDYVSNRPTMLTDPMGLAQCLYEIGNAILTCISSSDPFGLPEIQLQGSSGLGSCKNNGSCHLPFLGPIEPGKYQMNKDTRKGHELWYRLEPIPRVPGWAVRLGLQRGGFALHLGSLSEGCINIDKNDPNLRQQFNDLLNMLNSEQGDNFLYVVP